LKAARDAADKGERRLLTEQHKPLEKAVAAALSTLGFSVRNMDDELPENQRCEDFRVTSTDQADWEGIVEVKSYTRGVAATDALKIDRHIINYVAEVGHKPDAVWWVTNHWIKRDPNSRDEVLKGATLRSLTSQRIQGLSSTR